MFLFLVMIYMLCPIAIYNYIGCDRKRSAKFDTMFGILGDDTVMHILEELFVLFIGWPFVLFHLFVSERKKPHMNENLRFLVTALSVWIVVSIVNLGFINASWKYEFPTHCLDVHAARVDYTSNLMFAFMPFAGSVIAAIQSGFGQDGFDLSIKCK